MIIYYPDISELFAGGHTGENLILKLSSGGIVYAQTCENDNVRILSVSSTEPMDYMDSRFQPGNILSRDMIRIAGK